MLPAHFLHQLSAPAVPPCYADAALGLDARRQGGITRDGANRISQWKDWSAGAHHFAQAVGSNQPLYRSGAAPGVELDGSNDCLTTEWSAFKTLTDLTLAVVLTPALAAIANLNYGTLLAMSANWFIGTGGTGTGNFVTENFTIFRDLIRLATIPADYPYAAGERHLLIYRSNPAIGTGLLKNNKPAPLSLAVNGNASNSTAPATANIGAATTLFLGASSSGASVFSGLLHELIVWPRVLTDSECTQMHGFLRRKWGLQQ